MSSWHSYPQIFALGHRYLEHLLDDPVLVEEKIDGSQFSFGRFEGELRIKSKGKEMLVDAPEKMFQKAVDTVKTLDLHDGWTYRGEYLSKPKHNSLSYDRTPKNNIIIFDINDAEESYLEYYKKKEEAQRIGLEIVPKLFYGILENNKISEWLETPSILGGQKIEGIVIKNYKQFGKDKKVLMGKYVSEAFKEVHKAEWKESNPGQGDIVQRIINMLKTPARWDKGIQHLRELGQLDDSPKDIGKLLNEIKADISKECTEEIKDELLKWAIGNILRGCIAGFPEYYKQQLTSKQFETDEPCQ
jgi:hypothetical protein